MLIWPMTLQNHVMEGSQNFISGNSSLYVTTLPSLEIIVTVVLEGQVVKGSLDYINRIPSR